VQESAAAARATTDFDDSLFDPSIDPDLCWIDYAIRGKK
jgi:hypothetical protein